jgi:serine/threonine protein kinase
MEQYEKGAVLGTGTFATVFLATHKEVCCTCRKQPFAGVSTHLSPAWKPRCSQLQPETPGIGWEWPRDQYPHSTCSVVTPQTGKLVAVKKINIPDSKEVGQAPEYRVTQHQGGAEGHVHFGHAMHPGQVKWSSGDNSSSQNIY